MSPTGPDGSPAPRVAHPGLAIAALAFCGLLVALVQTMVVPLLPEFPRLLDISTSTASWLVTATLVAGAVSAPALGRLGDTVGKRRMLLVSLGLILAGSILGTVAPNVWVLLAARALQGASFGVIALGMSLMRDILPPERVGFGVGIMSSTLSVGGALGLPLAGLLAQNASWRWLFAAAAIAGLVQLGLVLALVPESHVRTGGRFDTLGAIGIAVALVCLLLAVSKGTEWGWTSGAVLGLLAATVVVLLAWGRYELRRRAPLVDLRVTARPAVLLTNIATVLIGFSVFATFVLANQLLQAPVATGYGHGMSMINAGLALLPIGAAMMIASSLSAVISRARGPRFTLVLGCVMLTVGNAGVATLPDSAVLLIGVATIGSIGSSLAYAALPLLIMRAVPDTETSAANSLNTLMRQLGTSVCTAVAGAAGAAFVIDVGGLSLPSGTAYAISFGAGALAALVAAVVALVTPAPRSGPVLGTRATVSS